MKRKDPNNPADWPELEIHKRACEENEKLWQEKVKAAKARDRIFALKFWAWFLTFLLVIQLLIFHQPLWRWLHG